VGLFNYSRSRVPELMDDPALDPAKHRHALAGLRRVNVLSRSDAILWSRLKQLAQDVAPAPLRILDVATGSGDVPVAIAKRFRKAGIAVEYSATDISPVALADAAQRAADAGVAIRFFPHDVLAAAIPGTYDVVTSSLFLHHLDEPEAVILLRRMRESATRAILINDLRRCRAGWWAAWIGTRILTRSPIVHNDGPVSVTAAYTTAEAEALAAQAGCTSIATRRCFPWRYRLEAAGSAVSPTSVSSAER
jgi:2-polyprenyl-3-methyl-5-hydroxy-6-metoxy-1,4-benzoquinol methylase